VAVATSTPETAQPPATLLPPAPAVATASELRHAAGLAPPPEPVLAAGASPAALAAAAFARFGIENGLDFASFLAPVAAAPAAAQEPPSALAATVESDDLLSRLAAALSSLSRSARDNAITAADLAPAAPAAPAPFSAPMAPAARGLSASIAPVAAASPAAAPATEDDAKTPDGALPVLTGASTAKKETSHAVATRPRPRASLATVAAFSAVSSALPRGPFSTAFTRLGDFALPGAQVAQTAAMPLGAQPGAQAEPPAARARDTAGERWRERRRRDSSPETDHDHRSDESEADYGDGRDGGSRPEQRSRSGRTGRGSYPDEHHRRELGGRRYGAEASPRRRSDRRDRHGGRSSPHSRRSSDGHDGHGGDGGGRRRHRGDGSDGVREERCHGGRGDTHGRVAHSHRHSHLHSHVHAHSHSQSWSSRSRSPAAYNTHPRTPSESFSRLAHAALRPAVSGMRAAAAIQLMQAQSLLHGPTAELVAAAGTMRPDYFSFF
jgi:hypothetical protein